MIGRRGILTAGLAAGAGAAALASGNQPALAAADGPAFNVLDFGARHDAAMHDDQSAAIQRAIDAAASGQGTVIFPPGVYMVKRPLAVSGRLALCGMGPGGRAALVAGSSAPVIESSGGATLWGLTISGMAQPAPVLVSLAGPHPYAVEDCLFTSLAAGWTGAAVAVERAAGSSLHISRCRFEMGTPAALRVGDTAGATPAQIAHNTLKGCGMQIGGDAVITGNVVDLAPEAGIRLGGAKIAGQLLATSNMITRSRFGIGVCAEGAGYALISMNMIKAAKDGAIRAFDGAKPVGPDLAMTRSEAFRHLALYGNVAQA